MLNDKETAVFNFIKKRLSDGISPSVREIMTAMDFRSTSTAHRYVETLIDLGLAEKSGGSKNRTIRLTGISSGRIIPVIGKGVGESAEFGGLLGSAPIMKVNSYSSETFVNRGGRIPAPIHSLNN